MSELIEKVIKLLDQASKILIIIHQDPDGDTIGSSLGLQAALKQQGKQVKVVGKDPVPAVFNFLPGVETIVQSDWSHADVIMVLDCGDLKRTGFADRLVDFAKTKRKLVNIDHHRKSDLHKVANINLFDQNAAATAAIIYKLIVARGSKITPEIATCLLCGLYTDTGGFRHSNTSPATLELASLLMERGAKLFAITKNLDSQKSMASLKLWGVALSRMRRLSNLGLVTSVITKDDLESANANSHDLAGLVNLINSTAGARAAILFSQVDDNTIKVSLRTERNDVDVSRLAEIFGGGGHKKAAGFTIAGKIRPSKNGWKVELE